ncbi:MAG: nucleotidyltransferase family protein [Deltaproteobacteria bacterium]|nr:nucleotidyltransferase family protein [Deltaproteobacteria bacterium]
MDTSKVVLSRVRIDRIRAGCRPSDQQELLLRAALFSGDAALDAWRKWRGLVGRDLRHLDMGSFGLIPMLYRNLSLLGVQDPLMDRFKGIFRRTWYQNQTLLHGCARALEALQAAGLGVLMMDGVPVVMNDYQDLGLRPMDGFDILVRIGQAEKAIHVLSSLDWKPSGIRIEKLSPGFLNAGHTLRFNKGSSLTCDLHWRFMPDRFGPIDDAALWEAAVPLYVRGVRIHALGKADQLLRACALTIGRIGSPHIQWIADAVVVLRRAIVRIDWNRLISLAQRYHVTLKAYSALFYLRQYMDVAIPEDVLRQFENIPISDPERRMFDATLHKNKLIGSLEHSWLNYRAYAAEYEKSFSPFRLPGFLEYLRLRRGHDSRWDTLRWAVSSYLLPGSKPV